MAGWEEIRDDVLNRIRAREWGPGGLIPGEEQLAADYGVARATVNRALQALAEAGLVQRRKRAGTRVTELPARRARLEIPVIRREVEGQGRTYAFRLLALEPGPLPDEVARRLGLNPGQPALRLETLHLADARPHAHEARWLNPAALPPLPDFAAISANEWLVATVPVVSGEVAFLAEGAGPAAAAALGVAPGTALLVAERATFGAAGPITLVRLSHVPGHRVSLTL